MFWPSHAKMHQAENQAHGREGQFPWRRGIVGVVIPLVSIVGFAAVLIYAYVTS